MTPFRGQVTTCRERGHVAANMHMYCIEKRCQFYFDSYNRKCCHLADYFRMQEVLSTYVSAPKIKPTFLSIAYVTHFQFQFSLFVCFCSMYELTSNSLIGNLRQRGTNFSTDSLCERIVHQRTAGIMLT